VFLVALDPEAERAYDHRNDPQTQDNKEDDFYS